MTRARCPRCGSADVRPSSHALQGRLAALLRLSAWRCRSCYRHFALRATLRSAGSPSRSCPSCGSTQVVWSSRPANAALDRALARQAYRCLACRRRFLRADVRQALFNLGFAIGVLALAAALASLAFSRLGARVPRRGKSPARQGPVTPPVLR